MIRPAKYDDIESVVEIYNQAIDAHFQTAYMERLTVADREEWFREHLESAYPLFVYDIDGVVAGWFSISPYRSGRAALRYTVEISYFVHNAYFNKGIGSQLVEYGLRACRALNYKTAIAIILDKNKASISLMEKFGFDMWAFLPEIADFDGVVCSHLYYGVKLADSTTQ